MSVKIKTDTNKHSRPKPFLKWAGGKRWFVQDHSDIFPDTYHRYIEPFLGSGAVYFHLCPEKAVLGDINEELIQTYQAIQQNWQLVLRYLREHHKKHSKSYYYEIRSTVPRSLASTAARFIYLNRTCWNGLYRVNQLGQFNVPIGTKTRVITDDDCFASTSKVLQGADLIADDFETLIDVAGSGDFVFVDPPYTVRHNHNAFIKYNEKLFSWFDQQRLFHALRRARNRGATIVGTNALHDCVLEMYSGEFKTWAVERISPISSKADGRKYFGELLFHTGDLS